MSMGKGGAGEEKSWKMQPEESGKASEAGRSD